MCFGSLLGVANGSCVIAEIRRFLVCGTTGVPSFSLSESISTRPSGGGRPTFVKADSNKFVNMVKNGQH